jgi:hypothetical protein
MPFGALLTHFLISTDLAISIVEKVPLNKRMHQKLIKVLMRNQYLNEALKQKSKKPNKQLNSAFLSISGGCVHVCMM